MSEYEREVTFEIIEHIGVLATSSTGWRKELNLVSWNGAPGKYDIRDWDPSHERMGRGITLKENEMRLLLESLKRRRVASRQNGGSYGTGSSFGSSSSFGSGSNSYGASSDSFASGSDAGGSAGAEDMRSDEPSVQAEEDLAAEGFMRVAEEEVPGFDDAATAEQEEAPF